MKLEEFFLMHESVNVAPFINDQAVRIRSADSTASLGVSAARIAQAAGRMERQRLDPPIQRSMADTGFVFDMATIIARTTGHALGMILVHISGRTVLAVAVLGDLAACAIDAARVAVVDALASRTG